MSLYGTDSNGQSLRGIATLTHNPLAVHNIRIAKVQAHLNKIRQEALSIAGVPKFESTSDK